MLKYLRQVLVMWRYGWNGPLSPQETILVDLFSETLKFSHHSLLKISLVELNIFIIHVCSLQPNPHKFNSLVLTYFHYPTING